MADLTPRPATPSDVEQIHELILGLAAYEREPDAVVATPADLHASLFGAAPAVFAHVVDGAQGLDGCAIWYLTYSTWEGRHGIHLEDLYVRDEARGNGIGKALLRTLAQVAVERGYRRVEWNVLRWNEPALGFYRALGAEALDEWCSYRLTGAALTALAD